MAGQALGCVLPMGKAPVLTNCVVPLVGLLCQKLPPKLPRGWSTEEPVETAVRFGPSHGDKPGPGKQEVLGLLKAVPGALQPTPN